MWFDAALVGYLFGVVFAVFGVAYRYAVWLRRPPTAMLNRRGWDAFRARKGRNLAALPALVGTHLLTQAFIRRRSRSRWLAHQLVFWGCILAALVTFPLTLGLLHFQSVGQQASEYQVYVSRVGTVQLRRREHRGLVRVPRARRRRGAGARRRVHLPAPAPARPRRPGRRTQRRLPRVGRTVRGVGHRAVPDGVEHVAGRPVLLGAEHAARADGHPRVDVHPVRQAVPHLPAAGESRCRVLQGGERGGARGGVPAVRRGVRERAADRRPAGGVAAGRVRLRHRRRRRLPGHVPALPAADGRARAVGSASEGSADGPATDQRRGADRRGSARTSTRRRPAVGTPGSRSTGWWRRTAASAASSAASS